MTRQVEEGPPLRSRALASWLCAVAMAIVGMVTACEQRREALAPGAEQSGDAVAASAPWRGLPEVWTPAEDFKPAGENPFPEGKVPQEAFKRAPSPALARGELLLTGAPDKVVRKHFYERDRSLVSELTLRSVALDFDVADEVLVTIPRGEGDESEQWLVLLDSRDGGHVIAGEWAWPRVRAAARVYAHSVGERALLWVELEGAEVSMVEAHSLGDDGSLKLVARLGGAVAERGRLTVEADRGLPVVHRTRGGQIERWVLSVSSEGFALVPSAPQ